MWNPNLWPIICKYTTYVLSSRMGTRVTRHLICSVLSTSCHQLSQSPFSPSLPLSPSLIFCCFCLLSFSHHSCVPPTLPPSHRYLPSFLPHSLPLHSSHSHIILPSLSTVHSFTMTLNSVSVETLRGWSEECVDGLVSPSVTGARFGPRSPVSCF